MAEAKKRGRKPQTKKETVEVVETTEDTTVSESAETVTTAVQESAPVTEPENREKDDEIAALKAMVVQLQQQIANQRPQVVQVMADTERVVLRFQAEVADDNLAVFGPEGLYGTVTGRTGIITVPKSEWSRFYNESTRNMINRRWLVVLTGMDQQEREMYNCAYKEGELLDERAFHKLLDMDKADLISVFPNLCEEHQAMVASRFLTAYQNGDERAMDRDLVVKLNEMSKETYRNADGKDVRRKGLFLPIVEALNAKDTEG